jgi:hypothetical protein
MTRDMEGMVVDMGDTAEDINPYFKMRIVTIFSHILILFITLIYFAVALYVAYSLDFENSPVANR